MIYSDRADFAVLLTYDLYDAGGAYIRRVTRKCRNSALNERDRFERVASPFRCAVQRFVGAAITI